MTHTRYLDASGNPVDVTEATPLPVEGDLTVDTTGLATEPTLLDVLAALAGGLPDALDFASLKVRDTFTFDRYPTPPGAVAGNDASQTIVLDGTADLIWVRCLGGRGFAKVTGVPALNDGILCEEDEPTPITVRAAAIKVWAPTGATVHVWGYGGDVA